jgi:protein-disulfide isomerase
MSEVNQLTVPVTKHDHVMGPSDAAVTLVEYGDFECPHCGAAHSVVKAIESRLGDELRFAYRHFPLSEIHPHATKSAEASEAAGAQNRFWDMHDMLFENQDRLTLPDLLRYALMLGLNTARFRTELMSGVFAGRVTDDFLGGVRSGVQGTPTFFINGVRHEGSYELPVLLAAVLEAAAGAARPPAESMTSWGRIFPPHPGT